MQIHITIELTGESFETRIEIEKKALRMMKEIEKEHDDSEENALERVEVTLKALEEHLMRENRQREYDRRAIALSEEAPIIDKIIDENGEVNI